MLKYKQTLIALIKKHIPKCRIYLFGSRARKTHAVASDIDLAIDSGKKIDLKVVGRIKNEINNLNVPFFIDIVDLCRISEEMKNQILKDGLLWSD